MYHIPLGIKFFTVEPFFDQKKSEKSKEEISNINNLVNEETK